MIACVLQSSASWRFVLGVNTSRDALAINFTNHFNLCELLAQLGVLGVLCSNASLHNGQFTLRANQCHFVGLGTLLNGLYQTVDTGLLLAQVLDAVGNFINLCDQFKQGRVFDLCQIGVDIVLKAKTPRDQRGQRDRHQHTRKLGFVLFESPHQTDSQNAQGQSGQMGVAPLAQNAPKIDQKLATVGHRQAKKLAHLRHGNDQSCGIGKSNDYGMGEKIDNHSEFKNAQGQLN